MKLVLGLLDQLVYLIACVAAVILAFFMGNLIFDGEAGESWWVSGFIAFFFLNAAILCWAWWRFSPLSSRGKEKRDD